VVLDLRLGQEDGLDLLRDIRAQSDVPIIITTGQRRDEIDRVVGLELGADDYITKPFGLRELLARIRAVLRRREAGHANAQRDMEKGRCRFGGWQLGRRNRLLTNSSGEPVALTKGEYALLIAFLDAPLRTLSREHLLQATRIHEDVFDRSIDVQVLRLRRKLETDPSTPSIIRTERGVGFAPCRAPVTTALKTQPEVHLNLGRRRGSMPVPVAKRTARMTTVALIPGAGIIPKHARDRFPLSASPREKSMSVAKHLSYARSLSQTERPRRIDGPSLAHLYIHHDEIGRARLQLASTSPRSAIAAASVKSRSIFRTAAQLVESSGDILLTVASWMLKQILDGCFAYAVAMYGMPAATIHAEVSEPESSAPPELPVNSSRPTLHLISPDIGVGETFSAGYPNGG
jgi:DNA-binding response OmpR family regulator